MNKQLIILSILCLASAVKFMPKAPVYHEKWNDMSFMHKSQKLLKFTTFVDEDLPTDVCTANIQKLVDDNQEVEDEFMEIVSGTEQYTDESFWGDLALDEDSSKYSWERAETILAYDDAPVKLFADPFSVNDEDINQGSLGNCYFLAAVSALAEYPQEITDFFVNSEENTNGAYAMRLVIGGIPRLVTLDDFFPSNGHGFAYNKVQDENPDIWVQLLEKAWAKINGNYQNTEGGIPSDPIHALTGAPSWGWYHDESGQYEIGITKADLLVNFKFGFALDYLFGTGAPGEESCGIVPYHAYEVQAFYEQIEGSDGNFYDLLLINNPWGTNANYPWEGDFSEFDTLWTEAAKAAVDFDTAMEDAANFFMHFDDYAVCFSMTAITAQDPTFIYNFVEIAGKEKTAVTFEKKVAERYYIQVETIFDRIFQKADDCDESYANGLITLTVVCNDEEVSYSDTNYQYMVTAMVEDIVGECLVTASVVQKDFYPKFTISIYSSEIINMQEVDLICEDYIPDGWDEWHFDISWRYNCEKMESVFDEGDCSGYDAYEGDDKTANQACTHCGGGVCETLPCDLPPLTGHYEYSKPVWFSSSQEEADQLADSTETPEVVSELVCHDKCDTCITTEDNCQTCASNRAGPPTCDCELGYFEEEDGYCAECASKCNTCIDESDNCEECDSVRTGAPSCDCPDGYYEDSDDICQDCDVECTTCNSSGCITCAGDRISAPDCTCPDKHYEDSVGNCIECDYICDTCDTDGCVTCAENREGDNCDCPDGTAAEDGVALCADNTEVSTGGETETDEPEVTEEEETETTEEETIVNDENDSGSTATSDGTDPDEDSSTAPSTTTGNVPDWYRKRRFVKLGLKGNEMPKH